MDFAAISYKIKSARKTQWEYGVEMGDRKEIIDTSATDKEEWAEAQVRYGDGK